nr:hypothetical protein [Tanacetum cinerariifolium]
VHDRYKSGEGYHAVPPPYTGTFMPPKPDLVFHDALTVSETVSNVLNVELSTTKHIKEMSQSNRPSTLIIKDWVSDSEDESEGIKREFSVARTPQHNGVVERKNRTLIEAAKTMLAYSLLPIPFWAKAVNTHYELLLGKFNGKADEGFFVALDPLGKFDGKADEGFFVGYSNTDVNAACDDKETENEVYVSPSSGDKKKKHDEKAKREAKGKSPVDLSTRVRDFSDEFEEFSVNSTNRVNAASASVTAVGPNSTNSTNSFKAAGPSNNAVSPTFKIGRKYSFVDPSQYPDDLNMPALEDIVYSDAEEDVGAEADFSNLETSITVSPIPTSRVHKDHLVTQIIGDLSSAPQTRSMTRVVKDQDLPKGKRAIGSKCVFRNKKDERWIVIRNKARLIAQGHTQEEGIDYEEVFAPVARIEAIRLFAYASFMGFMVYQMDFKSAFLYGTIEGEVYVCQPPGFEYLDYPDKELCNAFEKLMKDKFQMSSMGELTFFLGLQVKQKDNEIFISQDKYVAEILRKFGLTDGKSASTPIDTEKHLLKDPDGRDVDLHIYMSMIGSLMYLTSSRPDIMFAVCACARYQVTPKVSHLHAVKRIFKYLKGKPHLGLWY